MKRFATHENLTTVPAKNFPGERLELKNVSDPNNYIASGLWQSHGKLYSGDCLQNLISTLNTQCSTLNTQCSTLNIQHSIFNTQYSMFNTQCSPLNIQYSRLNI